MGHSGAMAAGATEVPPRSGVGTTQWFRVGAFSGQAGRATGARGARQRRGDGGSVRASLIGGRSFTPRAPQCVGGIYE